MKIRECFCLLSLSLLTACSSSPEEAATQPQALVTLAPVKQQNIGETVTLYGAADAGPSGKASLVAPIEARLVAIEAPTGSAVRQGQAIVRLAPGPIATADISKARSDAQSAYAAYARAIRLRADGLVSDADVETARAAKTAATATLASLTLQNLTLRSPLPGHVETINGVPGDLIPAGTAIVSISGNGAARARFGVDPGLVHHLRPGAPILVSGAGMVETQARLTAVDPTVDPQTKLASAYAALPSKGQWQVGETLTGKATLTGANASLVIPYAALLDDGGQPFVFVVAKGIANRHDVITGPTDGSIVAISKGLSTGDKVVVAGGTALEDGMKVRLK